MSDLISLEAALDAVREAYENEETLDGYEYRLNELPSVEIIHCKDCKYGEQDEDGWWYCGEFGCEFGDGEKGDGFCSDATRRKDAPD